MLVHYDPVIIGELTPPSYSFLNIPRTQTDLYGGIGILYRSSLKLSIKQTDMKTITFEHAIVIDVLRCVQYIVVYRQPPSAVNGFKTKDYLTEIDEFLSDVNMSANKIVALGDFNLHVDVPTKSDVATFMSILSSLNMSQHVVDPTHKRGHTLDLIITRFDDDIVKTVMCVNVSVLTIMLYILMCARRNHQLRKSNL